MMYEILTGHVAVKMTEKVYEKHIATLKQTNAELLEVVRDCVNFLADLNTTAPTDRAKSLHKRAYTAHSKAKEG